MSSALLSARPRWLAVLAMAVLSCSLAEVRAAAIFEVALDAAKFGNLKQGDVCGGAVNPQFACGPTAAVNSFAYLESVFLGRNTLIPTLDRAVATNDRNSDGNVDFYDDMIATAVTLSGAKYMNTGASGTTSSGFILGKQTYLHDRKAALGASHVKQEALVAFDWATANPGVAQPGYVTDSTLPDWPFLYRQLGRGADIEVGLAGGFAHFVTVTGFYFADMDFDDLIDQGLDIARLDYIDPATGALGQANLWNDAGRLWTDYRGGQSFLISAIAEVVPEPATLILLLAVVPLAVARGRPVASTR